jgi:CHASE2 domain-containing sensor protein
MRNLILVIFIATTLIVCGQGSSADRVSDIVLINTSGEKCEIEKLLNLLNECNPKVIGLVTLLTKNGNAGCDDALIEAISQSGKVVLIEGLYDSLSDESFYVKAKYPGETGIARHDSDSSVDFYYRISPYSNGRFSFPYLMSLHYDKSKGPLLASQSFSKPYSLMFYHEKSGFKVLTIDEIAKNCNQLSDKIVLVGKLTEHGKDVRQTEFKNSSLKQLNITVLQANIILDILKDLDNKGIKINKYADYIRQQQMNKD